MTATLQNRTLTSSKGKTVETALSDAEALELIGLVQNSFAKKLRAVGLNRLSHDQLVWVHVLAQEAQPQAQAHAPAAAPAVSFAMSAINELFGKAKQRLKNPSILLSAADGIEFRISVAGAKSQYAGQIHVAAPDFGAGYYGRIDASGAFHERPGCPDSVKATLAAFAADPAKVAADYGKLHGNCCFCRLKLTDERSTEVGYGKICAGNYGLDWGSSSPKTTKKTTKKQAAPAPAPVPAPAPAKPSSPKQAVALCFQVHPERFEPVNLADYEGNVEGLTCDGEYAIYHAPDGATYRFNLLVMGEYLSSVL